MEIKVVVEIPKGSQNKYERDEETGEIMLDRTLYGPHYFPFEYGSIPSTKGEDGDELDVVLLTSHPTFSGCVVQARAIGYLEMEDEKGVDHKVVAVPIEKIDPRWGEVKDIADLGAHQRAEIKEFFETYKRLEPNKWVKVTDFKPAAEAEELIEKAKHA